MRAGDGIGVRRVIEAAGRSRLALGHENLGFLSDEHGFMPVAEPRLALPASHGAWDEAARVLPSLYRGLAVRRALEALPMLSAAPEDLPDDALLRAAAILGILAHAYWHVETQEPAALPAALAVPWAELRRRLGRGGAALSYIDLIVYNWRLADPGLPRRLANLRLLVPTVDNDEERIFYLTQTEILAVAAPVPAAIARAQEAVADDDQDALDGALATIARCLDVVVRESLPHINPHPQSRTHVDPVVWAKTVAPFAVPLEPGVQGPSGTSSPIFNALDLFLGRKRFESFLGKEIHQLRDTYPPFWRELLAAIGDVSIPDYVERRGRPRTRALLHELHERYAGRDGFLGRHRMKVFGYLEMAFKVGRSLTIGGFAGVFKDRTWEQVDGELERSRGERTRGQTCHHARVKQAAPAPGAPVASVVLDVSKSGVAFSAGDRVGVLPENGGELVARTLAALGAEGQEPVVLDDEWRAALRLRDPARAGAERLPIADLLRFGRIRPLTPRAAEAIHAITQDETLARILFHEATEKLELWDLVAQLAAKGLDPRRLWQGTAGKPARTLCAIVAPETFRLYSVSSAARGEVGLTVGRVRYESAGGCPRSGTASSYLANADGHANLAIAVERPPHFRPPRCPATPVLMLAGGSGVSPCRALIAERLKGRFSGPTRLVLGVRSREHFAGADDLLQAVAAGRLALDVAFSRDDVELAGPGGALRPGPRRRVPEALAASAPAIWELVRAGAHVYVCGHAAFARAAVEGLRQVCVRFEGRAAADARLARMWADGLLVEEVFGGGAAPLLPEIDLSEVARHTDEQSGVWTIIEDTVYDLTDFLRRHPGGRRSVLAYAGCDATSAYARAHGGRPDVDAMRAMYAVGRVRKLDLEGISGTVETPAGREPMTLAAAHRAWVRLLHLVVEMGNALRDDQSLQHGHAARDDEAGVRSPYKLQRAVETHQRFLRSALDVLLDESLPAVWAITQGLFARDEDPAWMNDRIAELRAGDAARFGEGMIGELFGAVTRLAQGGGADEARLAGACADLEEADRRLLADLRERLIEIVATFERLARLGAACRALPGAVARYQTDLRDRLGAAGFRPDAARCPAAAATAAPRPRPLILNDHWSMIEDAKAPVVVMRRLPRDFRSLGELERANEDLLRVVEARHREFGVVVDMRQVGLRNDPEFENAMRNLRDAVYGRFARVALVVRTRAGALQVERLDRSSGTQTFVSADYDNAVRFAAAAG